MTVDRIEKLNEIKRLLLEVRGTLNGRSNPCQCCGGARYEQWDEKGCRDRLNAAIKRVETVADILDRKGLRQAT